MWQSYGWKKPGRRIQRTKKKPVTRRFTRVSAQAQIVSSGEVVSGRVFLYELSSHGVGIFLERPVSKNEQIYLVIEYPRHLFLKGHVAFCGLYSSNLRVLAEECFQYRAYLRFDFDSEQERRMIEQYCREL
ncbi:MAG: PilZ domain-containing protein [Bdellovibrionota bacterium]